eukprot:66602_1
MAEKTEFEVQEIQSHMVLDDIVLYHVSWKPCFYTSLDEFWHWLDNVEDIKKVNKHNKTCYKIDWKTTWVPKEDLNCPELLGAYVLADLKRRSEAAVARDKFKQTCCQMLNYAVQLEHKSC